MLASVWAPRGASADLRFRAIPGPGSILAPLEETPVGLPSAWRLTPNVTLGALPDPVVSVSLDPITGLVRESYREVDVEIREPIVASGDEYARLMSSRTRKRYWREKFRPNRSILRTTAGRGSIFRVELPVQLPKAMRSIVGDGAPNLEVSGSETITLGGTSDWTVNRFSSTGEGRPQSKFPSFEMKQELNVNLTGSIGDKIKVDVDQSSNVQTSLDNKVKLRYEGDDDDMIKLIELGNTNLSLQGASIRQEGLFGVKAAAKMGNVDVVTIASKQEGKNETARFTPSGEKTRLIILDQDYIKRTYFALTDHAVAEVTDVNVFKDTKTSTTAGLPAGMARIDPNAPPDTLTNPWMSGNWTQLAEEVNAQLGFYVERDHWLLTTGLQFPVIRLVTPLGDHEVLAVSYKEKLNGVTTQVGYSSLEDIAQAIPSVGKPAGEVLLKMLKPPRTVFHEDSTSFIQPDSTNPWYATLKYELRNFYSLNALNINPATMSFAIRRASQGQTSGDPDHDNDGTPYLRHLGLDQKDAAGNKAPDGKIDLRFVDTEKGILFFPELNPFDPAGVTPASCPLPEEADSLLCLNDPATNPLRRGGREDLIANPMVYYRLDTDRAQGSRYYIDAEFQSSRQGYFLGRFDILEGSEVVKVDGVPMKSGLDYTIDYTTGQLNFLRVPGSNQTISVDYSFAPGAGQVQRTLLGFSTTYNPAANASFSSSALYESKGAQEQLVKLGEEPATSLVGDFSTVLAFQPVWMTQLTNRVPGIQTSQGSALNIQGGISTSIPDPNTKGEAYVDDMEGTRESNSLSLTRAQWMWSSVPVGRSNLVAEHALLQWYNPVGELPTVAHEHDLKPPLKDDEGGKNVRQVLELNVQPPTVDSTVIRTHWTGITLPLGTVGQDLSKVRFIEVWVNDFRRDHATTIGKLHVDFGRVSEDAFWNPNESPNGQLDTEDKNKDGRLDRRPPEDVDVYLTEDEDTGLDGVHDERETGTGPAEDPNQDNYDYHSGDKDFSRINRLEDNALNDPNARPDTEDLNRDWGFDIANDYFETTIDLSRSDMVAIDVPDFYAGHENVEADNGWRLFRIPVDSAFTAVNHPAWNNVLAARLWLDDMDAPLKIQIGGIELIGNRWLTQSIPASLEARGVDLEVLTRNNKDDDAIYDSPYEVQNAVGSTAERREQSLALSYENLAPKDTVLAFKTIGDVGNTVGWTLYQELRFYVHGDSGAPGQNLRAVARFGADTVNYYEYSVPVRSGWQSIVVPMERLSSLKALRRSNNFYIDRDTGAASEETYAVFGNPTFTRINRLSFGVTVEGAPAPLPASGEVWIDELRLAAVRKDRGISSNVSVQANFADLLSLNGSYNKQDEDFFRVGQGSTQGSGLDHTAVGLSSTLNLDRFFPASGLQLPVRVSLQHSSDVPKFRTGSDVILDPARSDVETRESNRRSIDLQYQRASRSKGIARYTLDAIRGSMEYSEAGAVNPQSRDSSWSFHTNVGYTALIGGKGVRIGPLRVNPIPQTFTFTTDWFSSRNVFFSRTLTDTSDTQELRSDVKQRLLTFNLVTSLEPLSGVRMKYSIQSARDMLLHQQDFFGFNKGTEIRHTQSVDLDYRPKWLALFQPQLNLGGTYNENAGPEVRLAATDPTNLKTISNTGSGRASLTLPITRLVGRGKSARDTSGTFAPLVPLRFLLSKLEPISVSGDFRRSAALSRVTGDPGPAFKSGFTEVFDPGLARLTNSVFQTARSYNATANTSFQPFDKLDFDIRGEYQLTFIDQVGGSRRNSSIGWPSVTARWPELQRILALNVPLSNLTLTSGVQRRVSENGPEGRAFDTRTETTAFTPLLGWEAMFRSGIRVTATSSVDRSRTFDDRSIGFFREHNATSTALQVNKNFPAAKGIKFPWSKTRVRLKNDLNLGASVNIGSDVTVLHLRGSDVPEVDRSTLNVGSSTTYNFSQAISGGFNLGYRQTTDRKSYTAQRGITIAFTGSFRF